MGKRQTDESPPSAAEKFHMWATSAKILYPIVLGLMGALGYTNKDRIIAYVLAEPDGNTEITSDDFRDRAKRFSEEIVERMDHFEVRMKKIEAASETDDGNLQFQIDELKRWHE